MVTEKGEKRLSFFVPVTAVQDGFDTELRKTTRGVVGESVPSEENVISRKSDNLYSSGNISVVYLQKLLQKFLQLFVYIFLSLGR